MTPDADAPRLKYRIVFYLSGLFFAITSYIVGTWAYALEVAAVNSHINTPSFWSTAMLIYPMHPFTFISWVIGITAISMVLGYLFDREVSHRRQAEQKANIDGLTEVYNHRYFQDRLTAEIDRANRYGRPLAVTMLDLDDFKNYNDQHGHQGGDRLLKWFADLCQRNTRSIDILARYGGEEFVIVMPETDSTEALIVAERIRQSMETEVVQVFGESAKVTVSLGVASLPEHACTRHSLVLAADTALYYAKRQGKNSSYVYHDDHRKVYRTTPERLKALLSDDDIGAIEALSAAVDAKDTYTSGHSNAVSRYAEALARGVGLSETDIESLRVAALLHDIGKIGTPDSILHKPGRLRPDERDIVEHHPGIGSQILQKVQQLTTIIPGVRHHHERFDGTGYPNGLTGENIPMFARIIALADAFDAMTSVRPYRPAMTVEQALEELSNCAGSQFDPELVRMFIRIVSQHRETDQSEAA